MSCRKNSYKYYNRAKIKEDYFYWLDLILDDEYYIDDWDCCEWCDSAWFDMYSGTNGYVKNMDQYHRMKVLTLLRSLHLNTATEEAGERGW